MTLCRICRKPVHGHKVVPIGNDRNVNVCSDECQAIALGNSGRTGILLLTRPPGRL